jgi:osmotically inducible protein OsmC
MAADRTATTVWNGDLFTGNGTVNGKSSGVLNDLAVTWVARTEDPGGKTSPEELVAAAHSSCYAMALSNTLAGAGHAPETLEVTATVTFVPGTGVTKSALSVVGTVPGLSADEFQELAKKGEEGCPISNLIRGGAEITLDARLA